MVNSIAWRVMEYWPSLRGVEVLQCAFLGHGLYTVTVTFFGQPPEFKVTPWTLNLAVMLNGVIGAVAQVSLHTITAVPWYITMQLKSYSTLRIWLIAGYLPITVLCCLLAAVRMVGVVAIGIIAIRLQFLALLITKWRWLLIAATSLGGFVDVLIAVALSWSLWRTNRGFEEWVRKSMGSHGLDVTNNSLSRVIDKMTMLAIGMYVGVLIIQGWLCHRNWTSKQVFAILYDTNMRWQNTKASWELLSLLLWVSLFVCLHYLWLTAIAVCICGHYV